MASWSPSQSDPLTVSYMCHLQFNHSGRGLPGHVVDGVLVSQPIRSLDSVVHVPPPVVRLHVAQGSVDASLGGHSVGPGGEELRDDGRLESFLHQTEGSSETGASSSYQNSVIGVVNHWILAGDGVRV